MKWVRRALLKPYLLSFSKYVLKLLFAIRVFSISGHIPRWYCIVKNLSNLLSPNYEPLNPTEHGWMMENDQLLPEKKLLLIPKTLYSICNCKAPDVNKRCGNRCSCRRSQTNCTEYCGCKKSCSNIII